MLAFSYFAIGQQWLICRHCPHYVDDKRLLRCHAAFGLPKFPKYKPGPLGRTGKTALFFCTITLFLYYFPFFACSGQWLFLAMTIWGAVSHDILHFPVRTFDTPASGRPKALAGSRTEHPGRPTVGPPFWPRFPYQ